MVLPRRGDIIRFQRSGYAHFGIYVGRGMIIHRSGDPAEGRHFPMGAVLTLFGVDNSKAEIREDRLVDVAGDREGVVFNFLDNTRSPYSAIETVNRARTQLGKSGYNVIFKNCEHFVTWCRYGEEVSLQVDYVKQNVLAFASDPYVFLIEKLVDAVRRDPDHN